MYISRDVIFPLNFRVVGYVLLLVSFEPNAEHFRVERSNGTADFKEPSTAATSQHQ